MIKQLSRSHIDLAQTCLESLYCSCILICSMSERQRHQTESYGLMRSTKVTALSLRYRCCLDTRRGSSLCVRCNTDNTRYASAEKMDDLADDHLYRRKIRALQAFQGRQRIRGLLFVIRDDLTGPLDIACVIACSTKCFFVYETAAGCLIISLLHVLLSSEKVLWLNAMLDFAMALAFRIGIVIQNLRSNLRGGKILLGVQVYLQYPSTTPSGGY